MSSPRKPASGPWIFRYSWWDAIPATLVYLHLGLILTFMLAWDGMSWPARFAGAVAYALSIGWNEDSVSHNFIHNPFFKSKLANRITEFALTLENGIPQTMYAYVHMLHHAGNSDYPDAEGRTRDPISVYLHGADRRAEPPIPYVFMQFWRDDGPFTVARQIGAKRPDEARRALHEFWFMVAVFAAALVLKWQFVLFLAPFYYLGQCFTALIAYYEHMGANPEEPLATGVSTYEPMYNFVFLNNGFHAEHHHRPKQHWSRMRELRAETWDAQKAVGVRVIGPPHFLGFLDPSSWKVPTARAPRPSAVATAGED